MTLDDFQVSDNDLSDAALSYYLESNAIAVDTETMGLIPHRDRLCLVQLSNLEGKVTAIRIIRGQNTAPNLQKLLEAVHVIKVFHFARFDLATLRYNLGINVNPIFCTKIASKLVRTYTGKHGLKDVVLELEQVELDKSVQSSDWGNTNNLSAEQLSYAANDVRYLLNIQEKLEDLLRREERWELAQECFKALPTIVTLDLLQFKDLFEH